jgi:hypothetical protein
MVPLSGVIRKNNKRNDDSKFFAEHAAKAEGRFQARCPFLPVLARQLPLHCGNPAAIRQQSGRIYLMSSQISGARYPTTMRPLLRETSPDIPLPDGILSGVSW